MGVFDLNLWLASLVHEAVAFFWGEGVYISLFPLLFGYLYF